MVQNQGRILLPWSYFLFLFCKIYEKIKNYQLTFCYDNKWKPEYDQWLNMQAGWTNHIDHPRIVWNSALTFDMIFTQSVLYEFGNIKTPTLLTFGQRDRTAL